MMRSLSNLLSTLEAQIGPVGLVGLLFGLTALLGFIFGTSVMGILSAARRRRALREFEEEQELMQNLLNETRMQGSVLQTENDALKAKVEGVSERDAKHEREIRQLSTELNAAQISLETKESELSEKNGLLHDHSVAAADAQANQQNLGSTLQDAMEKGRIEGLETGLKEGLEKGRSEGHAEGLEQGRSEGHAEGLEQGRSKGHEEGLEQGRKEAFEKAAASATTRETTRTTTSSTTRASTAALAVGAVAGASGSMAAAKPSEPPTLIKRVSSYKEGSLSSSEAGIIPDDQIIPTLPEAELTANVEAYDLSDLEDLVSEDM